MAPYWDSTDSTASAGFNVVHIIDSATSGQTGGCILSRTYYRAETPEERLWRIRSAWLDFRAAITEPLPVRQFKRQTLLPEYRQRTLAHLRRLHQRL